MITNWLIFQQDRHNTSLTNEHMSPWQPLLGLLTWSPIFKSSHCNSLEDRAPVDLIFGCPLSVWAAINVDYRDISSIRRIKSSNLNASHLVLQLPLHRRCSNYIWVINNFIAFECATYIRGFMVVIFLNVVIHYIIQRGLTLSSSVASFDFFFRIIRFVVSGDTSFWIPRILSLMVVSVAKEAQGTYQGFHDVPTKDGRFLLILDPGKNLETKLEDGITGWGSSLVLVWNVREVSILQPDIWCILGRFEDISLNIQEFLCVKCLLIVTGFNTGSKHLVNASSCEVLWRHSIVVNNFGSWLVKLPT